MRVSSIYGSYHHRVGASLFDHPVEIHKRRCVGPNQLLSRLHSLAVDIAKPYDFHDVAIAFHDLLPPRSEEHTSELQSHHDLVCRLLLEKKNNKAMPTSNRDTQQPHI